MKKKFSGALPAGRRARVGSSSGKAGRPAGGRAAYARFGCPCGCGKPSWFTQPRSLRTTAFTAVPVVPVDGVVEHAP